VLGCRLKSTYRAPDMPFVPRHRIQKSTSSLRLQTIVRLRWIAVIGQLFTVLFVHLTLGFQLPLSICLAVIVVSAWLNVFLRIRYPARHRLSAPFATLLLTYDIVQLALLLYLTGGLQNPFAFLIVAPVTVSAASLAARNTILLGLIALAATTVLMFYHLPLPWSSGEQFELPLRYKLGMWASVFCGLTFIGLYAHRLAKETREMSEALAATEHVMAREHRLHALDGLAAAAAHELGTPLSTISVVAKELARELPAESPFGDDVDLLRSQAQRCREILETLTHRSNEGDPLHDHLPLTHLIEEAVEPFRVFEKEIRIVAGPHPDALSHAAEEPIAQRNPGVVYGLTNIIENAVDFARQRVEITAEWHGRIVKLTISDDGPGFAPSVLDALGEPYLTTRRSTSRDDASEQNASGLGLGFFIAKTLLERSGAEIDLANKPQPGRGAIVQITWPREIFEHSQSDEMEFDSHAA